MLNRLVPIAVLLTACGGAPTLPTLDGEGVVARWEPADGSEPVEWTCTERPYGAAYETGGLSHLDVGCDAEGGSNRATAAFKRDASGSWPETFSTPDYQEVPSGIVTGSPGPRYIDVEEAEAVLEDVDGRTVTGWAWSRGELGTMIVVFQGATLEQM